MVYPIVVCTCACVSLHSARYRIVRVHNIEWLISSPCPSSISLSQRLCYHFQGLLAAWPQRRGFIRPQSIHPPQARLDAVQHDTTIQTHKIGVPFYAAGIRRVPGEGTWWYSLLDIYGYRIHARSYARHGRCEGGVRVGVFTWSRRWRLIDWSLESK